MDIPFDHRLSVVLCPLRLQQQILAEARKKVLKEQPSKTVIIQKEWPLFPYLSLKDQVFLNTAGKKEKKNHAKTASYLDCLKLSSEILAKQAQELTLLEKIKLQLLHSLIADKKQLLLEEVFDQLTIPEIQEILTILKLLVKEKQFSILVFTDDATIAQSSYVDELKIVS
ncbi:MULTISPECIES: hypothetical protein [unclassified Enterococcus]|jgi:ABC-type lipoprotein export system ATPase subunit|uniref:hypothetical protein n=1 Tax=unclassified Enterococcus TaxID=2608891 RepID=UPI003D266BA5